MDITEEQRKILVGLLHRHLPDVDVWAYGSRVKWTARPNSDLDLVAFAAPGLESQVAELKDALAESDLPFLVDLHIWDDVPKRFHEIIRKEYVVLHEKKDEQVHLERVSDWTAMTLGGVTHFTSGGTPSKQNAAFWSGYIPWLSAKDMKSFYIDDTEDHITQEGLESGSRLAPAGTVFLLARGMTLLNDVPICVSRRPMAFNQDVKGLTVDERFLIPEFLPYLLLGHKARLLDLVDLAGHGTGRLNTDDLKSLSISVPPKVEQRVIANVLRSVDDKIELNRKTNVTLETTARTLFQSWFVDFDPVRAKAEGRESRLPSNFDALFPDRFEDSSLGPIPHGWEIRTLSELTVVITKGTTPTQKEMESASDSGDLINYIRVNTIDENGGFLPDKLTKIPRSIHMGVLKRSIVRANDVLYTIAGTIGRIAIAREYILPANTNQAVAIIRPAPEIPPAFLVLVLSHASFRDSLHANIVQAVQANLSLGMLSKAQCVLPPIATLVEMFAPIEKIFKSIEINRSQSRSLVALRDSLLPGLISGELRVNNTAGGIS